MPGKQLELPLGHISSRQFEPVAAATQGAARYTEQAGLGTHNIAGLEHTQASPQRGFAVQRAYKEAQAAPTEAPGIRDSYGAMQQHVDQQYKFMSAPREQGGMGLQHEVTEHDPYPTSEDMAKDVQQGKIKTMSTATTGGHEFFSNEDNDKFRAVHDVFGHAAIGRGFSRHGEEAAFLSHRQMFPKEAHPALASETRGQNSFLNYGATSEHPEPSFPEQGPGSKLVGLPKVAQETGKVRTPRKKTGPSGQESLF